ncbi:AAA family ATPase [Catenulispora yoronensis]
MKEATSLGRAVEPFHRGIVMVSGAPGAGKTTLARPLARALGMPLFAKDSIKERIHDVLAGAARTTPGTSPATAWLAAEPPWSRRLGAASMELLWLLAADAPACVLEANFWYGHEHQNASLRALTDGGRLVEVHCTVPREEAIRRYAARHAAGERHAVHTDATLTPERWEQHFSAPIGVGQVIEVDTSGPVDVAALAVSVRALLG